MSVATQRDTREVLKWYEDHPTKSKIGFDPDGMCMKVCRTARNIGPGAPSALASQKMTPKEYRVYDVAKIKTGDVLYFDDPVDGNPYGHIVTAVGRAKGFDLDDLGGIIVKTNSVKADSLVAVRAPYFQIHWSDQFQFAGRWLNGEPFYDLTQKPKPKPKPEPKTPKERRLIRLNVMMDGYHDNLDLLDKVIQNQQKKGDVRVVQALLRDRRRLRRAMRGLSETIDTVKGRG